MTVPEHPYWSLHTHSRYSFNDAMPQVPALVAKAVSLGYPALGLTDHGSLSGLVQFYKSCRKSGIEPFPGIELYVTGDRLDRQQGKMHLTVAAYSERGYRNLVGLNNLAVEQYYYKPTIDLADLAGLSNDGRLGGLVVATGCYFGIVQQTLIKQGPAAARQIVKALASWFPMAYVELHNHGVPRAENEPDEEEIVTELISIAHDVGIPYIIASDAHYLEESEQPLHNALKQMVSFSDDPSEGQFPGGPYCLPDSKFLKRFFEPEVVAVSNANLAELASVAHVRLPELEAFQLKVPDVTLGKDPDEVLESLVFQAGGYFSINGIKVGDHVDYVKRVDEELEVIRESGMAGYLLLVYEVCKFMHQKGIWFHARGSATGSLVTYMLRITQHDPVAWGLRMDRFMGKDRTRPPDIDLDVEHERRDEVVRMLESRFSVRPVGNMVHYKIVEEADADGETEGKGSLMVKYQTVLRKKGEPPRAWAQMSQRERNLLRDLADRKLMSGYSTHAAGYIVAPDEASVATLPIARIAGRKFYVTAYAKKDVEACGYCKLDLLGLKTKTAVRLAASLVYRKLVKEGVADPFSTAMEWYKGIPTNDKEVFARISRGDTEGMFQLSGKAMKMGCQKLKPKNIQDLVASQALFRPAMFQGKLDTIYLKRREKKEPVPVRHNDIMEVTRDTFGIALYQEQVIDLCRRIGMSAEELTDTLDAVKASNDYVEAAAVHLLKIKGRVGELASIRGWVDADVEWLVDSLAGYAEYSFNKAHSVAYGVEAYRSAYLAVHHPLEFWNGMLTAYANEKQEVIHVRNARGYGIRVKAPHVNHSGATYKIDNGVIRRGLVSVKGVGFIAARLIEQQAPFSSLKDFGERVPGKVGGAKGLALGKSPAECGGMVARLDEAEAFEGLS